VGVIKFKKGKR